MYTEEAPLFSFMRDGRATGLGVDIAQAIAHGALSRTESRGAQARTDFPDRDDEKWLVHSRFNYTGDDPRIDYDRKVTMTKWEPTVRTY